ncbi:hypothetical protein D9M69_447680 [compost metagenome]
MADIHSIAPSRRTVISRAVHAQFHLQKNSRIPEPIRVPGYFLLLAVAIAQRNIARINGKFFPGVAQ